MQNAGANDSIVHHGSMVNKCAEWRRSIDPDPDRLSLRRSRPDPYLPRVAPFAVVILPVLVKVCHRCRRYIWIGAPCLPYDMQLKTLLAVRANLETMAAA